MKTKGFIFSDTHWNSSSSVPDFLFDLLQDCDFAVHAGDWTDGEAVCVFSSLTSLFAVCGNCDYSDVRRFLPVSRIQEIGGVSIGITHGRRKGPAVLDDLSCEFPACDLVIFGHSHVPFCEKRGRTVFFNPGSLSFPRGGFSPSYGIIEIENGNISLNHVFL